MTSPRNAPCPCNSGKKYKHCCGRTQWAAPSEIDVLRNAAFALEDRLIEAMGRFASRRFGPDWLDGVIDSLGLSHRPPLEHAQSYLFSWCFFLFPVEGRRLTERYLEDRGSRLRDDERAFLLAQIDAWPTLWEARDIRRGEGVGLRDLLTGAEVFVNDHGSSKSLERYHVMLARVVKLGRVAIFGGAHPQPLPPLEAQRVVEAARRLHGRRTRAVPADSLRSFERAAELFRLWDEAVLDLYARPAFPQLQNTDGEPLLLTSDYFAVGAGQQARVRTAIAAMEGAEALDDDPGEFVITKPGNASTAAMSSTTIARLVLGRDELVVETNSLARADRIRAAVERACGDSIRHRIRKHTDPATLLRQQGSRGVGGGRRNDSAESEDAIPPEVRAQLLQDFKKKHYASWVDDQLPILGGKTPREAMSSAAGRARVEALVKDLELHEARLPEAERFDVNEIRRELGLELATR